MKTERKIIEEKIIYVADNGKKFKNEYDCEIYEEYFPMTIYDIIQEYCIIEERDIEDYKNNKIPHFSYLILMKEIPEDKRRYCEIIEKGCSCNGVPSPLYCENPTLFYNDWSNAYNGGYGSNGWKKIGTKEDILKRIEQDKKMLEKFNY